MEKDGLEEHKSLMHELNKGKELAENLAQHLRETSSSEGSEKTLGNILASYNEALSILSGRATQGQCQTVISSSSGPPGSSVTLPPDPPGSSISLYNVTQSKDSTSDWLERKFVEDIQKVPEGDKDQPLISSSASDPCALSFSLSEVPKDSCSGFRKRKSRQEKRTEKISEEALDDGYAWRKYGQKGVPGSKYPRSYYRCSYRPTQRCLAVKQVQRSDDDPSVFDVIYRGEHTCQTTALESKQTIHAKLQP